MIFFRSIFPSRPFIATLGLRLKSSLMTDILTNHSKYLRPPILMHAHKLYQEHQLLMENISELTDTANVKDHQLKRLAEIEPIASLFNDWRVKDKMLSELQKMKESADAKDKEFFSMIMSEINDLVHQLIVVEECIKDYFLPKDNADRGDAIIEVRAGTGGLEANSFTHDVWYMYQRYAEKRGWSWEPVSSETGEMSGKGLREGIACIHGPNVYGLLKFESGVHRVQRVPDTEGSGRIHTSTMTVAILPLPEQVDFELSDRDLKVDVFRSSGAGGQHVNTTNSAVRITHIPTGLAVVVQEERSQLQNRIKALSVLKSKLYQMKRDEAQSLRQKSRREQIGTAGRHEKIRTYNYPQGRVTDHRINFTVHHLEGFMNGNLDPLIDALVTESEAVALVEFENNIGKPGS